MYIFCMRHTLLSWKYYLATYIITLQFATTMKNVTFIHWLHDFAVAFTRLKGMQIPPVGDKKCISVWAVKESNFPYCHLFLVFYFSLRCRFLLQCFWFAKIFSYKVFTFFVNYVHARETLHCMFDLPGNSCLPPRYESRSLFFLSTVSIFLLYSTKLD